MVGGEAQVADQRERRAVHARRRRGVAAAGVDEFQVARAEQLAREREGARRAEQAHGRAAVRGDVHGLARGGFVSCRTLGRERRGLGAQLGNSASRGASSSCTALAMPASARHSAPSSAAWRAVGDMGR